MAEIDPDVFRRAVVRTRCARWPDRRGGRVGSRAGALHQLPRGDVHPRGSVPGAPIGRAIMNTDNRAVDEAEWWERTIGRERLYRVTGLPPHPMYALPKIRWLQRHRAGPLPLGVPVHGPVRLRAARGWACRPSPTTPSCPGGWRSTSANTAGPKRSSPRPTSRRAPARSGTGRDPGRAALGRTPRASWGSTPVPRWRWAGTTSPAAPWASGAIDPGIVADSAGTYECLTVASRDAVPRARRDEGEPELLLPRRARPVRDPGVLPLGHRGALVPRAARRGGGRAGSRRGNRSPRVVRGAR